MPWKETCLMDERVMFIAECLGGELPMTALCERYGISRKTGYKWLGRYRSDPVGGLPTGRGRRVGRRMVCGMPWPRRSLACACAIRTGGRRSCERSC